MPLLDVSDVLGDPDFQDTFVLIRGTRTMTAGVVSVATTSTPQYGVVLPASGDRLARLPDADRIEGGITIYTQVNLTAGNATQPADVVEWHGAQYTVFGPLEDWTGFGSGFNAALCIKLTLESAQV